MCEMNENVKLGSLANLPDVLEKKIHVIFKPSKIKRKPMFTHFYLKIINAGNNLINLRNKIQIQIL